MSMEDIWPLIINPTEEDPIFFSHLADEDLVPTQIDEETP